MNTVGLIDCMVYMKECNDNDFDLAIVDPPYGIGAPDMAMGSNATRTKNGYPAESTASKVKKNRLNSGGGKLKDRLLNTSNCEWDTVVPGKEYFDELFRVSKNQIIWGGNYFDLPPTRGIICWDKCQPWENFSQFELAWTSFDKPAKMFRYSNTGGRNNEKRIHPTQKPVVLYKWILQKYASPGNLILDTHVGSGSSRIACYDMGFKFVGCEIGEFYFEGQENRFRNHVAQGDLFSSEDIQESIFQGSLGMEG